MQRHVVDALARLALDHLEKILCVELHDRMFGSDLVDRHRAEDDRASREQLGANLVEVGAGRKVHHRVGAVAHRGIELLDLLFEQLMEIRGADIGVDLGAQPFADSDCAELDDGYCAESRPRRTATSARISSGERPSSSATSLICRVIIPLRAASIWVISSPRRTHAASAIANYSLVFAVFDAVFFA